ncbi:MAG: hypothetical protein ABI615_02605 [Chthoniobacterales bacterium]
MNEQNPTVEPQLFEKFKSFAQKMVSTSPWKADEIARAIQESKRHPLQECPPASTMTQSGYLE